jgi:hypothetical protein
MKTGLNDQEIFQLDKRPIRNIILKILNGRRQSRGIFTLGAWFPR